MVGTLSADAIAVTSAVTSNNSSPISLVKNNINGSQILLKHAPVEAIKMSTLLGATDPKQKLQLRIVLPLNNQEKLKALIKNLYDPTKPDTYHHFLTPVDFAEKFGSSDVYSLNVQQYLQSQKLSVEGVSSNKFVLNVSGSVADVQRAFSVQINNYKKKDGTLFFASPLDPTIPANIAGKVVGVLGLDNLKFTPHMQPVPGTITSKVGTGHNGLFAPADIIKAYNMGSIPTNGHGQTAALFELDGYRQGDITTYESYYQLPNVSLQNVLIGSYNGSPLGSGGDIEVTIDIEILIGIAPGLNNILVYEADQANNPVAAWSDEWTRIAQDNLAKVVSCSWGINEGRSGTINFDNNLFQQMAAQGQTVFAAAGDTGAYDDGSSLSVDEPAAQPYVTGVGISLLSTNLDQSYKSESASAYGGGGISSVQSIPSYQVGMISIASQGSTTMRNVPDVVLNADPTTGYDFYVKGQWMGLAGSSIAAPIWAAFTTRVNQGRSDNGQDGVGFLNPSLYSIAGNVNKYASDFHDITTGRNSYHTSGGGYPAVTGYDDASGLGSFNGVNLYLELVPTVPPAAPTGLTAVAGDGQVTLSWSTTTGAVSYNIKRSLTTSGPYTDKTFTGVTTTSFIDSTVVNGTRYYYVISAVNLGGESSNSAETSAMPRLAPPSAPIVNALAGNGQAVLSWNTNAKADTYTVKRSTTSGGPYTDKIVTAITSTSYTDSPLSNGSNYFYVVSGANAAGEGLNSLQTSAIPTLSPPSIPAGLTAVGGDNQVQLSWTANTSGVTYNLKRSKASHGPYTDKVINGITATSYTDSSLTNNTTYYYVLSATNGNGEGLNSPEVSALTGVRPPTNLTGSGETQSNGKKPIINVVIVNPSSYSVHLSWTQSITANVTKNKIYRSTSANGTYSVLTTLTAATSYTDTDVNFGSTYYYYVTALDASSTESLASNKVMVSSVKSIKL